MNYNLSKKLSMIHKIQVHCALIFSKLIFRSVQKRCTDSGVDWVVQSGQLVRAYATWQELSMMHEMVINGVIHADKNAVCIAEIPERAPTNRSQPLVTSGRKKRLNLCQLHERGELFGWWA